MPTIKQIKMDKKKIIIAVAGFLAVIAILFGVLAACGVFNKNVPDEGSNTEDESNTDGGDGGDEINTDGISINFDANGATGAYESIKVEPNENNTYTFTEEEKAAITGALNRDGYDLKGLSTTPDGEGSWTVSFAEEQSTVTVYAIWNAIFTHEFGAVTGFTEYGRTLSAISIPSAIDGEDVTSIGNKAFYNYQSFESVTIANGVTVIGDEAFAYCLNLKSITIPDSVESIGKGVFSCTVLTSVIIPNSVTGIKYQTFYCCGSLTDVTLPSGLTDIGEMAFSYCTELTEIIVPKSVESIADSAFFGCESLTAVYYAGNASEWNGITVGDYNTELTDALYYYSATKPTAAGDYWHDVGGVPAVWDKVVDELASAKQAACTDVEEMAELALADLDETLEVDAEIIALIAAVKAEAITAINNATGLDGDDGINGIKEAAEAEIDYLDGFAGWVLKDIIEYAELEFEEYVTACIPDDDEEASEALLEFYIEHEADFDGLTTFTAVRNLLKELKAEADSIVA